MVETKPMNMESETTSLLNEDIAVLTNYGAIDIDVQRNAYGRQVESFETDLDIAGLLTPFHAMFIRAPQVVRIGLDVEVLSTHEDKVVLARQGSVMVASFHPELTSDSRIHSLFLQEV